MEPGKRQNARQDIESGEEDRTEHAETGDPGQGIMQNLLKIEKLRRHDQRNDHDGGRNDLEEVTVIFPQ